jgi:hypothetical protein
VIGKIQYGSAPLVTPPPTLVDRRAPRLADPARFPSETGRSRSLLLLCAGSLLLGAFLAAVPREMPGILVATVLGGAWLSLVLAMTLPTRSQRAGAELARRLGQFRHEVNLVGDQPTRVELETLLARARDLELKEEEIEEELAHIRASLDALELATAITRGTLPIVSPPEPLAPGDACHFVAPVRFGRRRSDQFGHLLLTSTWLKFRGALEVSVSWSEVEDVQRAGREVLVALHESKRVLRFSCDSVAEAARGGVIAECLANTAAAARQSSSTGSYHPSV